MALDAADVVAWVANITTSVAIIFANKLLLASFSFRFAVTLSGLHYLSAALLMQVYKWSGLMSTKRVMPWKERAIYCSVSALSIVSLNISLMVNTVRPSTLELEALPRPSFSCWQDDTQWHETSHRRHTQCVDAMRIERNFSLWPTS